MPSRGPASSDERDRRRLIRTRTRHGVDGNKESTECWIFPKADC